MAADCNSDITNFCEFKNHSYKSNLFGYESELVKITAYVKEGENEIEVQLRGSTDSTDIYDRGNGWRVKIDKSKTYGNSMYNHNDVYLKAGTEWWFKYHILLFNEECVRTNIDNFDKNEMFMYAVIYGKLPEDIEDGSSTMVDKDIFSILPLLKPEEIKLEYNDNILLIACTRHNLKLVKFLVENCGIKLSAVIHKGLLSSNKYLLNEIAIHYANTNTRSLNNIKIEKDDLNNFMDRLISYALEQNPPVTLVNQDIFVNAEKYRKKYKDNFYKLQKDNNYYGAHISGESGYYAISEEPGGYIHWLKSKPLPPQQSITAKVCDAFTPGCLKTTRNNKVYADAGGSKKRVKKTRKQRKPRNSKRNHNK
jgi:hypothetical protein